MNFSVNFCLHITDLFRCFTLLVTMMLFRKLTPGNMLCFSFTATSLSMWKRVIAFANITHFVRLTPFHLVCLLHQFGVAIQTHTCLSLHLCITSQRQNQTSWTTNRSRCRNKRCYGQFSAAKAPVINSKVE